MADRRSKKIAFLCHCLINQNSKVEGFAYYPAMVNPLVELLMKRDVAIVQLPCAEEAEHGIGRPVGDDTKQYYDTADYRDTCSKIADEAIYRIRDYLKNGYEVKCILGVDGSPSCGVNCAPVRSGGEAVLSREKGIFIEILSEKMEKSGMGIDIIGIPETEKTGSLKETLEKLEAFLV